MSPPRPGASRASIVLLVACGPHHEPQPDADLHDSSAPSDSEPAESVTTTEPCFGEEVAGSYIEFSPTGTDDTETACLQEALDCGPYGPPCAGFVDFMYQVGWLPDGDLIGGESEPSVWRCTGAADGLPYDVFSWGFYDYWGVDAYQSSSTTAIFDASGAMVSYFTTHTVDGIPSYCCEGRPVAFLHFGRVVDLDCTTPQPTR